MVEKEKTFSEIYQTFLSRQEIQKHDSFTAACNVWLQFENNQVQASRLAILYILYSQYSNVPLDHNPFLTFFLQLVELPISETELHFVYCILEETLSSLDDLSPQEVCNDPNSKLPAIKKDKKHLELLELKVARLIEDPDIIILDENICLLLSSACTRILTLKENELLRMERLSNYPLTQYITPNHVNQLIDLNQFIALDIVPLLLQSEKSHLYLQALLNTRVTINSLEVMHHVLVNSMTLSPEFLHYYISNSIRSCEQSQGKDRQVKQVAKFIQSLLEKNIISMKDYFVEIQSFCISFIKLKGVANLFRLASHEAQQQKINF